MTIRGGRLIVKGTLNKPVRFEGGSMANKAYMLSSLTSNLSKRSVHRPTTSPSSDIFSCDYCPSCTAQKTYALKIESTTFQNNVENVRQCPINATGNWWGDTAYSIIPAKIVQSCIPTNLP
jgi:hypothetical protein